MQSVCDVLKISPVYDVCTVRFSSFTQECSGCVSGKAFECHFSTVRSHIEASPIESTHLLYNTMIKDAVGTPERSSCGPLAFLLVRVQLGTHAALQSLIMILIPSSHSGCMLSHDLRHMTLTDAWRVCVWGGGDDAHSKRWRKRQTHRPREGGRERRGFVPGLHLSADRRVFVFCFFFSGVILLL